MAIFYVVFFHTSMYSSTKKVENLMEKTILILPHFKARNAYKQSLLVTLVICHPRANHLTHWWMHARTPWHTEGMRRWSVTVEIVIQIFDLKILFLCCLVNSQSIIASILVWWKLLNFIVLQIKFNIFLYSNEIPQRIFWNFVRQLD